MGKELLYFVGAGHAGLCQFKDWMCQRQAMKKDTVVDSYTNAPRKPAPRPIATARPKPTLGREG